MSPFSPNRPWYRLSSGVLAALSCYFLCGREWAWARDARAPARSASKTQANDKAAIEAKRQAALQEMREFTHGAEQEAKAAAHKKKVDALLNREGDKVQRELAKAKTLKLSPAETKTRLSKVSPKLAAALAQNHPVPKGKPLAKPGMLKGPNTHFGAPHLTPPQHGALLPQMKEFYAGFIGEPVFIEGADTSLFTPEELLAGVVPPHVRLAGLFNDVSLGLPLLGALGPPTSADLAQTVETAQTPEVLALAASLGGKALALYNYVHTQVQPELYYGSKKGAGETLAEGAGNDFDQAALLIALLRASNIPSRYEYGTVQLSAAQALALTGASTVANAASMLSATGPATLSPDGNSVQAERVWVRAYVPYEDYRGTGPGGQSLWVRLDPGLKRVAYSQAVNLKGLVSFNAASFLAAPTPQTPEDIFEGQLLQAAQAQNLCNSLDSALQKGAVAPDAFTLLPADHPAQVLQSLLVFSALPTNYQYQMTLNLDGDAQSFPLTQFEGHSLTLRYVGATAGDVAAIQAAGGIQNVVPYQVNVAPSLQLDGVELYRYAALSPGTTQTLTVQVTVPGGSPQLMVHTLYAGTQYAVLVNGGILPKSRTAALAKALDGLSGDDLWVAQSQLAVGLWAQQQESAAARMFALQGHGYVKDVSEGVAGRQIQAQTLFGLPVGLALGGWVLDVGRDSITPLPRDGNAALVPSLVTLSGYQGSTLEAKSWEQVLAAPAISTVRIIQNASAQQMPVYTLSPGNTSNLANLTGYSQDTLTDVNGALAAGWSVTLPQRPVSFLTYSDVEGYILYNPVDGSGAFRINESLNGGADDGSGSSSGAADTGNVCSCASGSAGSTVNLANGNMREQMTDLTLPAVGLTINWNRTYASRAQQLTDSGYGWMSSYGVFLQANLDGSFTYFMEDWRQVIFTPVSGGFQSGPGWHMTLTTVSGGAHSLRTKNGVVYAFNAQGQLTSVTEPAGNITTLAYSGGLLSQVNDSSGNVALTVTHTGGKISQVADRAGRTVSFSYSGDDLASATDALGNVESYQYDGNHNLTQRTDKRGQVWLEFYDANDRWTGGADPTGATWGASYDFVNQRTVFVDRTGAAQTTAFNTAGNPTSTEDAVGNTSSTVWDADLNPLQATDSRGYVTSMTYDTTGNQLSRTDPDGRVTTTQYEPTFNQPTEIDATGLPSISNAYNGTTGRLTSRSDGLGTTVYAYDGQGQLQTVTAPGAAVTSFTHDGHGSIQTTTDPTNGTTVLGYDAAGHLTSLTDPSHNTRTLQPDALGRVQSMTDALQNATSFTYDAAGNRTSTTDAAHGTTGFVYDVRGWLSQTRDAQGHVSLSAYDNQGRVTSRTDAKGNTTSMTYDAAGRLSATTGPDGATTTSGFCAGLSAKPCAVVDALGNLTATSFDAVGRVTTVLDALGRTTNQAYDSGGRLHQLSGPNQVPTTFSYGNNGLLSQTTTSISNGYTQYQYDARGNRTTVATYPGNTVYTYDLANRLLNETNPLNQTTTYTYDAAGNRHTKVDGNDQLTTYGYDANRRLTSVTFADSSQYVFQYDEKGNRTLEQSPSHSRSMAYDSLNRLFTVVDATLGRTLAYGYDGNGNRASLTVSVTATSAVEQQYAYGYDANNRLAAVTDTAGNTTTFQYDADGRRNAVTRPNGVTTAYIYDTVGQVQSIVHSLNGTVLQSFAYGYDGTGNRTLKAYANGNQEVYAYDTGNRLQEVDYSPTSKVTYGLDEVGNRISESVNGSTVQNGSFNNFNQLTQGENYNPGTVTTRYAYDGNGNTLSASANSTKTTTYTWDLDNRLRFVSLPSGTVDGFNYDANGLRIQKVDSTGITNYLLDHQSVVEETDVNSNLVTSYLPNPQAIDEMLSFSRGGATYYPLTDALGSIYAVTDATGNVVATYSYDVYGARTQTSGTLALNYGFTGREHDPDTGLVYHRDRYRDPTTGGWLQPDRRRMSAGPNQFLYANAMPTMGSDPLGQQFFSFSIFDFEEVCPPGSSAYFEMQGFFAQLALEQIADADPVVSWREQGSLLPGSQELGPLAFVALAQPSIPIYSDELGPSYCARGTAALGPEIDVDWVTQSGPGCQDPTGQFGLASTLVHESMHIGMDLLQQPTPTRTVLISGTVENTSVMHVDNYSTTTKSYSLEEYVAEAAAYYAFRTSNTGNIYQISSDY